MPPGDIMPFGKFRNEKIEDVPSSYLQWALETWDFKDRPALAKAMQEQLDAREGKGIDRTPR